MCVGEVSHRACCLRMAFSPISLSMASLRLAARGTLAIALIAIGIAIAPRPAFAVGEEITDVRVLDNQRTEESTVRSVAGRLHRRHAGGRHARYGARAAQHHRPLRRRQRLVGAARLGRADQHLGQGQVPLGAGPHRLLVLEQQVDRAAVRARQPVRARQAAAASARAWRRSIRAPSSPTAIPRCSGPGCTGSCRGWCSARSSPSTRTRA